MARSFSNVKAVSVFVANEISAVLLTRRGYAAVASKQQAGVVSRNPMLAKGSEESKKTTSWVPDPVTGYYRPENKAREVDAAELREMLVENKNRGSH